MYICNCCFISEEWKMATWCFH